MRSIGSGYNARIVSSFFSNNACLPIWGVLWDKSELPTHSTREMDIDNLCRAISSLRTLIHILTFNEKHLELVNLSCPSIIENITSLYPGSKDDLLKYSICGSMTSKSKYFYKCFTCCGYRSGIFCTKCWIPEKHVGHKYSMMYCSGTCDCGDLKAIDNKGMCDKHKGISDYYAFEKDIPIQFKDIIIEKLVRYNFLTIYSLVQAMYDPTWLRIVIVALEGLKSLLNEKSDILRYLISGSFTNQIFPSYKDLDGIMIRDTWGKKVFPTESDIDSLYGMVDVQTMSLIFGETRELDVETFVDLFGGYSFMEFVCYFMTQFHALYEDSYYSEVFQSETHFYHYLNVVYPRLSYILSGEIIAIEPYKEKFIKIWPIIIPRLAINQFFYPINKNIADVYDCFPNGVFQLEKLVTGSTVTEETIKDYSEKLSALKDVIKKVPFTSCAYQILMGDSVLLKTDESDELINVIYLCDYLKFLLISKPSNDDGVLADETRDIIRECVTANPYIKSMLGITLETILNSNRRFIYTIDEFQPIFTSLSKESFIPKTLWSTTLSLCEELQRKDNYNNRTLLYLPDSFFLMCLSLMCFQYTTPFGRIKSGVHIDETDYVEKISTDTIEIWRYYKFVRLGIKSVINGYKYIDDSEIDKCTKNIKILIALIRMWLVTNDSQSLFRRNLGGSLSENSLFNCLTKYADDMDFSDVTLPIPFGEHCLKARYKTKLSKMYPDKYSFHIPLHRLLSVILFSLQRYKQYGIEEILDNIGLDFYGSLLNEDEEKEINKNIHNIDIDEDDETHTASPIKREISKISPVVALGQHPLRSLFIGTCFKLFARNGGYYVSDVNGYIWSGIKGFNFNQSESDQFLLQSLCSMQRKGSQFELASLLLRTFGLEEWSSSSDVEPVEDIVPGSTESSTAFGEILINTLLLIGKIFSNRALVSKTSDRTSICKQAVINKLCSSQNGVGVQTCKTMFPTKYRNGKFIDKFLDEISVRVEDTTSRYQKFNLEPNSEAWRRSCFFNSSSLSINMEAFIENSFAFNKDFPPSVYSLPEHSFFPDKFGIDPLLLLPCTTPIILLLTKIIYTESTGLELPYISKLILCTALIILVSFKNISKSIPEDVSDSDLHKEGLMRFEEVMKKNIPFLKKEEKDKKDTSEINNITLKDVLQKLYGMTKKKEYIPPLEYLLDIPKPQETPKLLSPSSPFSKSFIKDYDAVCPVCLDNTDGEMTLCAHAKCALIMPYRNRDDVQKGLMISFCRHSYHFDCFDECLKEGTSKCSLCNNSANISIPFVPKNYVDYIPAETKINEERKYRLEDVIGLANSMFTIDKIKNEELILDNPNRNKYSQETLILVLKLIYYHDILFDGINEMIAYDQNCAEQRKIDKILEGENEKGALVSVQHALIVLITTFLKNLEYQEQIHRPWELNEYKTPELFKHCEKLNIPKHINRSPEYLINKTIDSLKNSISEISALVFFLNHIHDLITNFDEIKYLTNISFIFPIDRVLVEDYGLEYVTLLACVGNYKEIEPALYDFSIPFQERVVIALLYFFASKYPCGCEMIETCQQLRTVEILLNDFLEEFRNKNLDIQKEKYSTSTEIMIKSPDDYIDETPIPSPTSIIFLKGETKILLPKSSYDFATIIQDKCECDNCHNKLRKTSKGDKIDFLLCLSCGKVICTNCVSVRRNYPSVSYQYTKEKISEKTKKRELRCALAITTHCDRHEDSYCNGEFVSLTMSIGTVLKESLGIYNGNLDSSRYLVIKKPRKNHNMYVDYKGSVPFRAFKFGLYMEAVRYDKDKNIYE